MRKAIYPGILLLMMVCQLSHAQSSRAVFDYSNAQQFMNDANGRPLYIHTEYEVEGTPFFSDDYCTANLKVRKGKTYANIKVKLNLQENLVIYDAGDGKEMAATSPIEKIEFMHCNDPAKNKTLLSGFPAIDGQNESSFYLLLDSGQTTLLKYIKVNSHDTKYYNNPNTTRVFEQKELYYTYVPGKGISKLNRDTDAVLSLFGNKNAAVGSFIAKNDLKCRREEDLVKVFSYYNSLN